MHSMLLKKKTKYNFGIFMNPYFSSLINREQNNKITGNVIKFDKRKGYGFIKPNDGGPDVFVHYTEICQNRSFSVTNEEKKKLEWHSNINLTNKKDEFNYEHDNPKKKEIQNEFKYLIPGERVKFHVIYDRTSHSSKAINVEFID
ncbi:cold-shock protein, putative [Plasmodium berghei]|uniref:Cold-shock protein, putative n=2 Tax=Plasmodium berghei TaxID=5821 RepID=A0A509AJG9_PLABA|nr:cold-shock protein, putative [Plasmodium berghei ANKA]CXH86390.1 cold-shock protein, putative [Plasmodium berghei]SCL89979.1 cold-shock protein, putative [Plasmodium berghei]SCM15191.1 cold-shock protein, putative [Plasmodium berghei]SCM16986.1 cold-shock protein, putative [Plasmodium berghei]SCN21816.1 cold-shock protein, putative [Plasmodium berghei]|eukprot:XP_034419767.1 cold-shock protein, putative [Plasmodium berghei ANKA]